MSLFNLLNELIRFKINEYLINQTAVRKKLKNIETRLIKQISKHFMIK